MELGEVRGIVAGNFGEVSEDTHALVAALATCRVRVAGVSRGRKGHMRTEEGERSLAIASLRRRLGVLTVRCQAHSLLGRLEALGPGAAAAAGRMWQAAEPERCWKMEEGRTRSPPSRDGDHTELDKCHTVIPKTAKRCHTVTFW